MRFRLELHAMIGSHDIYVAVIDTYHNYRRVILANNTDEAISEAILRYYNQDCYDMDMDEDEQREYIKKMMSELPKDLAFKDKEVCKG